jgi:hypothetical protein
MGDNQKKDKQAGDKQAPAWVTFAAAILSLISALLVAIIGYFGNTRIAELQSETSNAQLELQREVESLNASIEKAEVELAYQKFGAEQQARQDEIVMKYVPQLLSSNESDNHVATAVLFVLYPNDAEDILSRVRQSLSDEEKAGTLGQTIDQAKELGEQVGDWAIRIGSDEELEGAQFEVQRAEEQGYTAVIYLQGAWYITTVGPFSTQTDAERENITIRSTIREGASVINLNSWCPQKEQKNGYIECSQQ